MRRGFPFPHMVVPGAAGAAQGWGGGGEGVVLPPRPVPWRRVDSTSGEPLSPKYSTSTPAAYSSFDVNFTVRSTANTVLERVNVPSAALSAPLQFSLDNGSSWTLCGQDTTAGGRAWRDVVDRRVSERDGR